MAIGWWTALKAVPWSDVIEAAPVVVKTARRYLARTQSRGDDAAVATAPVIDAQSDALSRAEAHVVRLQVELSECAEQQRASAALLESLAEQQARMVQALDVLRARVRLLVGGAVVLAAALAALAAWVAMH